MKGKGNERMYFVYVYKLYSPEKGGKDSTINKQKILFSQVLVAGGPADS
jgi:hypothetical protein